MADNYSGVNVSQFGIESTTSTSYTLRGTWDPTYELYPENFSANSMWLVDLPVGTNEYTFDGTTWVEGDFLVYDHYNALYSCIHRNDQFYSNNVLKYGYIGDGTYHPLQELVDSGKYNDLASVQTVYPKVTSLTQSIDWAAIQTMADECKGKTFYIPKGLGVITQTIVIPEGTIVCGEGKFDIWQTDTSVGTVITTYGSGNPAIWTDITGTDAADDTPMFVAGGAGVYFIDMAVKSDDWSVGVFYPATKQCGFQRLLALGFTDACVYIDATWSSRNTYLQTLHPEVTGSSSPNEFLGIDFYLRTSSAGSTSLKIQGTTRAGDSVAIEPEWKWGYGGVSDCRFHGGRLSAGGTNGACFSHDVQLFGATSYAQGTTFRDTAFRLFSNGKYYVKMDRTNRLIIDGAYAEHATDGSAGYISVTSRTKAGKRNNIFINDNMNGKVELDGVEVSTIASYKWQDTGCFAKMSADGRASLPCFHGIPYYSGIPEITSFYNIDGSTGYIDFGYYNGTSRQRSFLMSSTSLRPDSDGSASLGTTSYPFLNVRAHNIFSDSGSVSVSDEDSKSVIEEIPIEVLEAWSTVKWKRFKYKNGTSDRWHTGLVVQNVIKAFADKGLDASEYGLLCYDEESKVWGIRYNEAEAIEAAYIRWKLDI